MYISKIQQPTYTKIQYQTKRNTTIPPHIPTEKNIKPTFNGKGGGAIVGVGGGLATGVLAVGGSAITGTVVLPAIVGSAIIVAVGIAGAYLGDKIEDKIEQIKSKKNPKPW